MAGGPGDRARHKAQWHGCPAHDCQGRPGPHGGPPPRPGQAPCELPIRGGMSAAALPPLWLLARRTSRCTECVGRARLPAGPTPLCSAAAGGRMGHPSAGGRRGAPQADRRRPDRHGGIRAAGCAPGLLGALGGHVRRARPGILPPPARAARKGARKVAYPLSPPLSPLSPLAEIHRLLTCPSFGLADNTCSLRSCVRARHLLPSGRRNVPPTRKATLQPRLKGI